MTHAKLGESMNPIDMKFRIFHLANGHVYRRLVEMARKAKSNGHNRIGIGMLFEVIRWELGYETTGSEFLLNNSFRSRYSRLIMDSEKDLAGIFSTRILKSRG